MRVTISATPADVHVDAATAADTPAAPMSVPDAIYHTVHTYPGGVAALAVRMGIPAGTLNHKANPNNATHYLRPDELVTLQALTGNCAVLAAMAAALGYTVTPATPDQSGANPMAALVRLQVEFADLVRAAGEPLERLAAEPGSYTTGNELRRVDWHAQELQAAVAHLVGALRACARPQPLEDSTC